MTIKALAKFEDSGDMLKIDLEALIGSHLVIQANSGGGKSGTIRRLCEVTYGKIQHIILDVEDEFYTLREKFEYMLAGGDNGDCAATVNNARALALMILETGFSAIVQINGLSMADRRVFIGEFLTALIGAPKNLWRPVLVILDEAQSYAPQVGKVDSSDGVTDLMTLGRKRGFTGVLCTPRAASIHKDATGPVNNWLMGRVGQPVDRRAVADALGFPANSPEARGLMKLVRREFWAFGPAFCAEPMRVKIEAIETTPLKAGQAAPPTPPTPAKMRKILADLNAAAAAAEEEPAPEAAPVAERIIYETDATLIAEAEARGFDRGHQSGGLDLAGSILSHLREAATALETAIESLEQIQIAGTHGEPAFKVPLAYSELSVTTPNKARADEARIIAGRAAPSPDTAMRINRPAADGEFTGPQRAILNSLATWKRWGHSQPSNAQIAFLANYSATSTSYTKARGALKSLGMIEYPAADCANLTPEGAKEGRAQSVDNIPALVMPQLSGPEQAIFGAVTSVYPRALSNEEAASRANYSPTSTSYTKARGSLKTKGLLDYPKADHLRANDWLFTAGARR